MSTLTEVVLLPGPDIRAIGGSLRARNQRVAARTGAVVRDARPDVCAGVSGDGLLVLVPPGVLINVCLFSEPLPQTPTWLDGGAGAALLAGPREAVSRFESDLSAAANLPRRPAPLDAVLPVGTPHLRRRALWLVLLRTIKPTDGWVSRHFNRPVSRIFSYALLTLGLNASQASTMTFLIGVLTAVIAARPGYLPFVITGFLFHFTSVLDGVDGEMARATLTESEAGARIDAIVDQTTYVMCFVGLSIGWAREIGATQVLIWNGAIALALVLSLMRGARFVSRFAPDASFVFIDRTVRRAARESNLLTLRVAAVLFTLLRRDLFAFIFLLVSLTGMRVLVPGLVAGGIVLANFTLTVYRREMAAAAVRERG